MIPAPELLEAVLALSVLGLDRKAPAKPQPPVAVTVLKNEWGTPKDGEWGHVLTPVR